MNNNSIISNLISIAPEDSFKDIYLHFLDRELLTTVGAYDSLPINSVIQDLRMLLFSTFETTYFSTSLVFENKFAGAIFNEFPLLFQTGHIELALAENSLYDFILTKRDQYVHAKKRYNFYFNDTWKIVAENASAFRKKRMDTSRYLEKSISEDISKGGVLKSSNRLNIELPKNELKKIQPYIVDSIKNRGKKAVTKLLFSDSFKKFGSHSNINKCFNIKVTENYISAYLHEYNGTIVTGLSSGIEYFSYLCPTYPLHHLSLWKQIYLKLGCLNYIRHINQTEIIQIRESTIFQSFISETRYFIHSLIKELNNNLPSQFITIEDYLIKSIRNYFNFNLNPPKVVDDFYKIIENCNIKYKTKDILSSINEQNSKSFVLTNNNNFNQIYLISNTMEFHATTQNFQGATFNDFKGNVVQYLTSQNKFETLDIQLLDAFDKFGKTEDEKKELAQALVEIKSDKPAIETKPFKDRIVKFLKDNKEVFGTIIKVGVSTLLAHIGLSGIDNLLNLE